MTERSRFRSQRIGEAPSEGWFRRVEEYGGGGPRCTGTGEKPPLLAGSPWGPAVRVPPSPSFRFLGLFWPRPGLLLALGDGVGVGIGSERVGRSGCGPRGYFLLH